MVSIKPADSNEPNRLNSTTSNNNEVEETKDNTPIWSQYDNAEYGEKGVIDEFELFKVVQDNLPPTAGIKATVDRFKVSLDSLKGFIGEKWNEDTYNKIIQKLHESNVTKWINQQKLELEKESDLLDFDSEMTEIEENQDPRLAKIKKELGDATYQKILQDELDRSNHLLH